MPPVPKKAPAKVTGKKTTKSAGAAVKRKSIGKAAPPSAKGTANPGGY